MMISDDAMIPGERMVAMKSLLFKRLKQFSKVCRKQNGLLPVPPEAKINSISQQSYRSLYHARQDSMDSDVGDAIDQNVELIQYADVAEIGGEMRMIQRVAFKNTNYSVGWVINEITNECMVCCRKFSWVMRRKHHCRVCGCLTCDACSSARMRLENMSNSESSGSRVCQVCVIHMKQKKLPNPSATKPIEALIQAHNSKVAPVQPSLPKTILKVTQSQVEEILAAKTPSKIQHAERFSAATKIGYWETESNTNSAVTPGQISPFSTDGTPDSVSSDNSACTTYTTTMIASPREEIINRHANNNRTPSKFVERFDAAARNGYWEGEEDSNPATSPTLSTITVVTPASSRKIVQKKDFQKENFNNMANRRSNMQYRR